MNKKAKRSKIKYIFVTGGVVSSLGKGIASASLGLLLKSRGLNVTIQKLDPYINVDPGTMSPFQHGEVYVTDDGAETDLDLGHYERFMDINMTKLNNTTTGQVYFSVIEKERRGDFLGKTVQVIPHITDEIKRRIREVACNEYGPADVIITEIGGTVGDIESLPFLEAIRQICLEEGRRNVINIHLTLVPYISTSGEIKTKPTQHSVMRLREIGLQPDIILCRTGRSLSKQIKDKIGLFCNVPSEAVLEARDVESIYEVPLMLEKEHLSDLVVERLRLKCGKPKLDKWEEFVYKIKNPEFSVKIGVCGKYTALKDAYKSIMEAFIHAGVENNVYVKVEWIESEEINSENAQSILGNLDGILIPGGFGERGIEGKIAAVRYARENKVPFLGICLGLQCAVIEFARNVCKLEKANSREFSSKTKYPVIDLLPEQLKIKVKGGTMRLGAYPCILKEGTKAYEAYRKIVISERHRHRYEVNNDFRDILEENGMVFSGLSPDNMLVEIIELPDHPWFVAGQFHPELKSRVVRSHPLFREFVAASKRFSVEKKERIIKKEPSSIHI
ncbi:CTP synthase [candidate division KSB1 bacterium]|nr:MAG: CTP synthase [candidate division KSB1 bacterium]